MEKELLKPWVKKLGLRHQGTLMAVSRGADGFPKEDISKKVTRSLRGTFMNSFDPNPSSFIEPATIIQQAETLEKFLVSFDEYPLHFIQHLYLAAEIVGYKCDDEQIAHLWRWFYYQIVFRMHLRPETVSDLDKRLLAEESDFKRLSKVWPFSACLGDKNFI